MHCPLFPCAPGVAATSFLHFLPFAPSLLPAAYSPASACGLNGDVDQAVHPRGELRTRQAISSDGSDLAMVIRPVGGDALPWGPGSRTCAFSHTSSWASVPWTISLSGTRSRSSNAGLMLRASAATRALTRSAGRGHPLLATSVEELILPARQNLAGKESTEPRAVPATARRSWTSLAARRLDS